MNASVPSPGTELPIVNAAEKHVKVIRERMKKPAEPASGVWRADCVGAAQKVLPSPCLGIFGALEGKDLTPPDAWPIKPHWKKCKMTVRFGTMFTLSWRRGWMPV